MRADKPEAKPGGDELVVVHTYLNRIEAELAHSALQAADIDSMIQADDMGGTRPHMWMSGVRLLVRAADVKRARALIR